MTKINDIVVLEDAAEDMTEGRHFYEKQKQSLGIYFWDSIVSDIESLTIYSGVHEKHFGLYRLLSRRFPYAIYYEISDAIAYVIAILPVKRSPIWISNKMRKRN